MAGRLAAEAKALWQMQNSTVQSQDALVVSSHLQGSSCACGGEKRDFAAFSPPCPTGEAGGKRPVPFTFGTTPSGTKNIHGALCVQHPKSEL